MIQVIHRALNILEYLAQDPQKEYFLNEISENLNLNKATCANIIKTLVGRGYIEQAGQRKGYKLGHMAYRLTKSTFSSSFDFTAAKVHINDLRDTLNENVILSVISNGKRILIHEAVAENELSVKTSYEQSPYRTSTGRVILAFYDSIQLDYFIAKNGLPTEDEWPGINSKEDIIEKFNEIRQSYCYIHVNSKHVASATVPIFSKNKIIASLGVYLPDLRFSEREKEKIVEELLKTAKQLQH